MKNINLTKMYGIVAALFLCILLLLCSTPLLAQKSLSVQEWYDKGRTALNAKRYDEAIDAFTKVIEQRNRAATTPRLLRAHAYANQAQLDKALGDLDSLIAWYTEDPKSISAEDIERAYFLRGEISSPTRGNSAAIKDFETVMLIAPQNIRAYFKRGTLRTNMRDAQGAIDDFTLYISEEKNRTKYKSDIALAFWARGMQYSSLKNDRAALEDYNSAIGLGIDSIAVYYNRAIVRANARDTVGAIQDLGVYIQHEQNNPAKGKEYASVLITRGNLRFLLADYDNALADLQKALKFSALFGPQDLGAVYLVVAGILQAKDRPEEAIAEYTHAIGLDADMCTARMSRGALYISLEKTADAKADFSHVITILEKKWESLSADSLAVLGSAYYNRALVLQFEGELAAAVQDLEKVAEFTTLPAEISGADVWRAIGDIKYELDDYAGALAAYDKATVQQPDQPAIFYYNRALIYTKMDDSLSAITSVTRATELQPNNADFYSLRGDLKSGLGQYAEALQDYTTAIRHDPDNAVHYFDRAMMAAKLNNLKQMCEDIQKARTMGLEAAQSVHADMVKQGICK